MGISAVHKYRSVGPIGREIIRGGAGELPSARLWKSLRLSRARATIVGRQWRGEKGQNDGRQVR